MAEIQEGKPRQVSTFTALAFIMSDHETMFMSDLEHFMIKSRVNKVEMSTLPILLGGSSKGHHKGNGYNISLQKRVQRVGDNHPNDHSGINQKLPSPVEKFSQIFLYVHMIRIDTKGFCFLPTLLKDTLTYRKMQTLI